MIKIKVLEFTDDEGNGYQLYKNLQGGLCIYADVHIFILEDLKKFVKKTEKKLEKMLKKQNKILKKQTLVELK